MSINGDFMTVAVSVLAPIIGANGPINDAVSVNSYTSLATYAYTKDEADTLDSSLPINALRRHNQSVLDGVMPLDDPRVVLGFTPVEPLELFEKARANGHNCIDCIVVEDMTDPASAATRFWIGRNAPYERRDFATPYDEHQFLDWYDDMKCKFAPYYRYIIEATK